MPLKFKIGDRVTFTNDYGVVFKGKTITGFLDESHSLYKWGYRYFWAPNDAHWMPSKEESLTPETTTAETGGAT